jgi:8-oxo-dGTP pyrophosphatase MutT (NUDIX family)
VAELGALVAVRAGVAMRLDLAELTDGQPFCTGLVLAHRGLLVLTLNDDHVAPDVPRPALRVGAVGGGQEPGENIWECALREAHEEIGVAVDLAPAPLTRFFDWEARELRPVDHVEDELAPLVVHRWERPSPDVPYKPGLPTGPYLYGADFLALAGDAAELRPGGDDLAGVLRIPLALWSLLADTPTLGDVLGAGAELHAARELAPDVRLWVHPHEGLLVTRPLLEEPSVRAALGV